MYVGEVLVHGAVSASQVYVTSPIMFYHFLSSTFRFLSMYKIYIYCYSILQPDLYVNNMRTVTKTGRLLFLGELSFSLFPYVQYFI